MANFHGNIFKQGFRVLLLGDTVGKTCIANRLARDVFAADTMPTYGKWHNT